MGIGGPPGVGADACFATTVRRCAKRLRLGRDGTAAAYSRSVAVLLRSSFGMLARKVVERSAETGEHYLARDRADIGIADADVIRALRRRIA